MMLDEDWHYLPGVYDALREITTDAPGRHVGRQRLGVAVWRWLVRNNRPTVPIGAMNRILDHAGYRRTMVRGVKVVHGLALIN
ncbi:hypothetical protein [Streptomyces altiplanensis]